MTRGLTQAEVSEATGLSRSAVSMYESGLREPDLDTLRQLAILFKVHPAVLLPDVDGVDVPLCTVTDEHRQLLNAWDSADPACRRLALDILLHFRSDVR